MLIKARARCVRAPVLPDRKLASLELDKLTVAFDELHNIWQLAISGGTGALGRHLNSFAPLRSSAEQNDGPKPALAAARKHRRGIDGDQKRELKPYEIRKDAVSVRRDINHGRSA